MAQKNILVRNIDEDIYREARSKVVGQKERMNMGQLITALLKLWLKGKIKLSQGKD